VPRRCPLRQRSVNHTVPQILTLGACHYRPPS
jgi:hypothetical protein